MKNFFHPACSLSDPLLIWLDQVLKIKSNLTKNKKTIPSSINSRIKIKLLFVQHKKIQTIHARPEQRALQAVQA
jgi:hypothetical protein